MNKTLAKERFQVVVCGAGIAGIEGLLRLRRLAGDQVDITLLSPNADLIYPPSLVLAAFQSLPARRFPIERIVADTGVSWVRDRLSWVDRNARIVHSSGGHPLPYDALLLAVGGRRRPVNTHMDAFPNGENSASFREIVNDVVAGTITDLAFVVPPGPSWPLPLYELALLTAQRSERAREPNISLITPERAPLHVFGAPVADIVTRLLFEAGVTLHCSTTVEMPAAQQLILKPGRIELHPQRTVTLPRITGPDIPGLPGEALHRFLDVDEHCRVGRTDGRIFAAGDGTSFPIKHGAVAVQQADTAAAGIAHLAGTGPPSLPLHVVIRAALITGRTPLYLSANVIAGQGWGTRVYPQPPWPADEMIIADELGPYLKAMEDSATTESQESG